MDGGRRRRRRRTSYSPSTLRPARSSPQPVSVFFGGIFLRDEAKRGAPSPLSHAHTHQRWRARWSRWEARRGATSELSPASLWISWKLFLRKVFPHVQLLIHPDRSVFHVHTVFARARSTCAHICMHKQLYRCAHKHAPAHTGKHKYVKKLR